MNIIGRTYYKCSESFLKYFEKICPCFYLVCFTKQGENAKLKTFCGFLYGLLLGLGFYELILIDLDFTEWTAVAMGLLISVMLGFGIAFSLQIRCIALLSFPTLGGQTGRSVLKTLVLAFVIAGPVANLAANGKEVARTFACTTSLNYNLTKTRFELMFKPFQEALFGMKTDASELKDTIKSIRDVSAPITGELEDEKEMKKLKEDNDYLDSVLEDTKRSQEIREKYNTTGEQIEAERYRKKYLEKIETRCEGQLTKAAKRCRDMFQKAYDKCYEAVTWFAAWLLCWPMKLTFVCNIMEAIGGSSTCDPSEYMDPGFGEGYMYLKHSRISLVQNFKDVKLQYQIGKIRQLIDTRDATDTAKTVLHTVKRKKALIDMLMHILKRILAFVCLRIIIDAQNYHDKYLREIEYDNIYITKYFRKIDARRHQQEKYTLLPLKKVEREKFVDPFSFRPLKREQKALFGKTVKLLLEMITATAFVILDRLFYETLDLIRRHARIDYIQEGHHDMVLQVKGTGLIASLLRSVVKGFNIKKRVKVVRSNAACLPQPILLSTYYLYKIYGTYFAIWLLIVMEAYLKRIRRGICAYYYRKREKTRVLFMYNEMLKRRIGFFRFMKRKVKNLVRERRLQDNLNVCSVLRMRFPKLLQCLRIFPMARCKCLICGEPEPCMKKNFSRTFVRCSPICHFIYCSECWHDLGSKCYACNVSSPENSDNDDPSEDSGLESNAD